MADKSQIEIIAYFGCWKGAGHFLFSSGWQSLRDFNATQMRIPLPQYLDGTGLFLPTKERVGDACITYLPAPHRTVLAWWGSPFDTRGAVNCAVITDGDRSMGEVWEAFKDSFPDPEGLITRPTLTP